AVSVLLLAGAGLLGRTLFNFYTLNTGFEARNVRLFSTNLDGLGYPADRVEAVRSQTLSALKSMPGVTSSSVSKFPPISGGSWRTGFLVEGQPGEPVSSDHVNSVAADFFRTYGTPVVLGREFTDLDTESSTRVAVVNESFARRYFKDQSPLGRWLAFSGLEQDSHYTIVGVVQDMKYEGLRDESPTTVYMASSQVPLGTNSHTFAI